MRDGLDLQLIKQHHNLLAKLAATPVGVTLSDLKDLQGLAAWVEPFRLVQVPLLLLTCILCLPAALDACTLPSSSTAMVVILHLE